MPRRFKTPDPPASGINGNAGAYTVDGEQFVALAVGSNIMCFALTH
jgi:hypothetical protein